MNETAHHQQRDSQRDRSGQAPVPNGDSWGCVRSTPQPPGQPRTPDDSSTATLLELLGYTHPAWTADALCREYDLDFTNENTTNATTAMQICGRLVMAECRQYALDDDTLVGIWGGTDTAARRAIRRTRDTAGITGGWVDDGTTRSDGRPRHSRRISLAAKPGVELPPLSDRGEKPPTRGPGGPDGVPVADVPPGDGGA